MPNRFKINFDRKKIYYSSKTCDLKKLYSWLMDLFDEPENMKYDLPITATAKGVFKLINGWTINKKSLKYLKSTTTSA